MCRARISEPRGAGAARGVGAETVATAAGAVGVERLEALGVFLRGLGSSRDGRAGRRHLAETVELGCVVAGHPDGAFDVARAPLVHGLELALLEEHGLGGREGLVVAGRGGEGLVAHTGDLERAGVNAGELTGAAVGEAEVDADAAERAGRHRGALELEHDVALITGGHVAHVEVDATGGVVRGRAVGGDEAGVGRQREVEGDALGDHGARGAHLLAEEALELGAGGEIGVGAVARVGDRGEEGLVVVGADAEGGDRHAGLAVGRDRVAHALGADAGAVDAVGDEHHATGVAGGRALERLEAAVEPLRDLRSAAGAHVHDRGADAGAVRADRLQRHERLGGVVVGHEAEPVAVLHLLERLEHRAAGLLELLAAHRAGAVEHQGHRDRDALVVGLTGGLEVDVDQDLLRRADHDAALGERGVAADGPLLERQRARRRRRERRVGVRGHVGVGDRRGARGPGAEHDARGRDGDGGEHPQCATAAARTEASA